MPEVLWRTIGLKRDLLVFQGEVYTIRHNPGEPAHMVQGNVLLTRAPTVDVGDVQIAKAVGLPPPGAKRFKHLPNVVIFSTQGEQPLLNSLSRGDMDGDLVGVIYDERLFPRRTEAAMQHKPKIPKELDRDCTIDDIVDFVLHFFRNDMLGPIANRVSRCLQRSRAVVATDSLLLAASAHCGPGPKWLLRGVRDQAPSLQEAGSATNCGSRW